MSDFSHGIFARQVPSETLVQAAVQKLLSFWTGPSLVALSPCLRGDPTAGAGGTSIRTIPTFIIATATRPLDRTDRAKWVRCARSRCCVGSAQKRRAPVRSYESRTD